MTDDFRPERALVIVAHPDDAEFLCGGTVARLADQGCDVFYLLATRRVVRDAVYPAAHDPLYHPELRELGLGPHRIDELWLFGTEEPDHHVDIGPYLERKIDALLAHESQMRGRTRDDLRKLWNARAKEAKQRTGFRFAESFRRIDNRPRPPGSPPGAVAAASRPRRRAAVRT